MKKHVYLLLACIPFFTYTSYAQWEWQHPLPQGNPLLDIFFIDQETGWAVGSAGTILRLENSGDFQVVVNFPTELDLYCVMFYNPEEGLCAGQAGILLKSSDGGFSWTMKEPGISADISDISLSATGKAWITGNDGTILYSPDKGENWEILYSDTALTLNSIYFLDDNNGWASGIKENEGIVLRTYNGGNDWIVLASGYVPSDLIEFIDSLTGYGIYESVCWMTFDGGYNWNQCSGGYYASWVNDAMFTDPNHGILVGIYGEMYQTGFIHYTENGGQTWELPTVECDTCWSGGILYCVHFVDDDHGWAAGEGGTLLRTIDGGKNWSIISDVLRQELADVFFADQFNGWAVGGLMGFYVENRSMILHTEDGGISWSEQHATNELLRAAFFIDQDEGWVAGGGGSYYRPSTIAHTSDKGNTWETQYTDSINSPLLRDIAFTDSLHGWVVGSSGASPLLLSTVNGGETWEDHSSVTENLLYSVCFPDAEDGWITGFNTILHTSDGGDTWEEQWNGEHNSFNDIYFLDKYHGWALGDYYQNGIVTMTDDGGITWTSITFDTIKSGYWHNRIFFTDVSHGWIAGNFGLLYSIDGGLSWQKQVINTDLPLNSICFVNEDEGWVVGDYCSILHTTTGSTVEVEEPVVQAPVVEIAIRFYPNPFSDYSIISYDLQEKEHVCLAVYDQVGHLITILADEVQSKGKHTLTWTAGSSAPGIYFYRIRTETGTATGKMILMR